MSSLTIRHRTNTLTTTKPSEKKHTSTQDKNVSQVALSQLTQKKTHVSSQNSQTSSAFTASALLPEFLDDGVEVTEKTPLILSDDEDEGPTTKKQRLPIGETTPEKPKVTTQKSFAGIRKISFNIYPAESFPKSGLWLPGMRD